ncbi:MAG TPA: hypothetical protein VK927_06555, partial [Adhaeribacter sp.]|nr:hypothetical protein [Adhaeribacter sp.]
MEPYQDPAARPLPPTQNPELSPEIKDYLLETAKWGKFLGIVGYIFVGLLVLTAIFAGTFLDNFTRSQIDGPVPNAATSGMFSIFMAFY